MKLLHATNIHYYQALALKCGVVVHHANYVSGVGNS